MGSEPASGAADRALMAGICMGAGYLIPPFHRSTIPMNPHNPIDHVVIIVKENHTFDNHFGTFPGAAGQQIPRHASDPNVAKLRNSKFSGAGTFRSVLH